MRTRPSALLVLLLALMMAALLAAVAGCASPDSQSRAGEDERTVSRRIADAGVTARIKTTYLFNPHLNSFRIHVDTDDGRVTLQGTVRTGIQKDLAGEIARHAEGVRSVRNDLHVGEGPVPDADDVERTFTQAVFDATITASVKTELAVDGGVKARGIDVSTRWGTVTLKGSVGSRAEKELAARLASETSGVRDVDNQLTIRD